MVYPIDTSNLAQLEIQEDGRTTGIHDAPMGLLSVHPGRSVEITVKPADLDRCPQAAVPFGIYMILQVGVTVTVDRISKNPR